jgi:hypothetical protein
MRPERVRAVATQGEWATVDEAAAVDLEVPLALAPHRGCRRRPIRSATGCRGPRVCRRAPPSSSSAAAHRYEAQVPAGSVVLFNALLLHGARRNTHESRTVRRAARVAPDRTHARALHCVRRWPCAPARRNTTDNVARRAACNTHRDDAQSSAHAAQTEPAPQPHGSLTRSWALLASSRWGGCTAVLDLRTLRSARARLQLARHRLLSRPLR